MAKDPNWLLNLFGTPQVQGQQPNANTPGGMSMAGGQMGVAPPTGPGVSTGMSLLSGPGQPQMGQPSYMNWLMPLLAAGGAALSTPSAGGAGPILGNAMTTGVGTYEQMKQLEAQRALATQKQAQLEQHRQAMEAAANARIANQESRGKIDEWYKENMIKQGQERIDKPSTGITREDRQEKQSHSDLLKYQTMASKALNAVAGKYPPGTELGVIMADTGLQDEILRLSALSGIPPEKLVGVNVSPREAGGGGVPSPPAPAAGPGLFEQAGNWISNTFGNKFTVVTPDVASPPIGAPVTQPTITPEQQTKRVEQQRAKGPKRQQIADIRQKRQTAEDAARRVPAPGHVGPYGTPD